MSLMAGDIGSMLRAQQSAQDDRNQAGQAVQNMRDTFAHLRPSVPTGPAITQLPTDGSYSGNMYRQPFARQAPMMDMRGIGGLLAGLLGGFGGGFRGGYGGGYPMPSAYMRERGQTQEYRFEDMPRQPSLQERQQAAAAIAAGENPAARLGGGIGISQYFPQGPHYIRPPSSPRYGPQEGPPPGPPMSAEQRAQSQARLSGRMQELGISPGDVPGYAAPPPFQPQGGFGPPQGGSQPFQPQGGFGQSPMGIGGKGGAKGGGMFGQPSYGMQARYSSPFGNLF